MSRLDGVTTGYGPVRIGADRASLKLIAETAIDLAESHGAGPRVIADLRRKLKSIG